MFLTLILLIAAQEAHATAQFRAASRGTQQSRFFRAAAAKPAAGTQ
jgi:hypothetical protein